MTRSNSSSWPRSKPDAHGGTVRPPSSRSCAATWPRSSTTTPADRVRYRFGDRITRARRRRSPRTRRLRTWPRGGVRPGHRGRRAAFRHAGDHAAPAPRRAVPRPVLGLLHDPARGVRQRLVAVVRRGRRAHRHAPAGSARHDAGDAVVPVVVARRGPVEPRRAAGAAAGGVRRSGLGGRTGPRRHGPGRRTSTSRPTPSQARPPRHATGLGRVPGGDAAWCASPISGMGTTLALLGAYVLAGELAAPLPPPCGVRRLRIVHAAARAEGPAAPARHTAHRQPPQRHRRAPAQHLGAVGIPGGGTAACRRHPGGRRARVRRATPGRPLIKRAAERTATISSPRRAAGSPSWRCRSSC